MNNNNESGINPQTPSAIVPKVVWLGDSEK